MKYSRMSASSMASIASRVTVLIAVLSRFGVGVGAERTWESTHHKECIIIAPAPGSHPPYHCCHGSSAASTTIMMQPSSADHVVWPLEDNLCHRVAQA